jgi:hypothetical protein
LPQYWDVPNKYRPINGLIGDNHKHTQITTESDYGNNANYLLCKPFLKITQNWTGTIIGDRLTIEFIE